MTRNIVITNGGLGCVQVVDFYIVEGGAGIQLNQVQITGITANAGVGGTGSPTLITPSSISRDTSFYTIDIEAISGAGAQLCNGQTITIEETVEILTCISSPSDGETRYGTWWECNTLCQSISTTSANTTIPPGVPSIGIAALNTNNNPDCFDGQTFTRTFRITNSGTTDAVDLTFDLELRHQATTNTEFILNSATATTSGGIGPTVLTPTVFTSSAIRDTLVDSIPAGEFVDVSVDVAHLCRTTNTCRAYDYDAYRRANITYEDRCNNNYTLGNSNLGGVRRIRGLGVIESNAPAIADGQTRTFSTTFSDFCLGVNSNLTFFVKEVKSFFSSSGIE